MKQAHVLTLILIFCWCSAFSQLALGVKSGINFSKHRYYFNDDFTSGFANINGFEAGIVGLLPFKNDVELMADIDFVQKGGTVPND